MTLVVDSRIKIPDSLIDKGGYVRCYKLLRTQDYRTNIALLTSPFAQNFHWQKGSWHETEFAGELPDPILEGDTISEGAIHVFLKFKDAEEFSDPTVEAVFNAVFHLNDLIKTGAFGGSYRPLPCAAVKRLYLIDKIESADGDS